MKNLYAQHSLKSQHFSSCDLPTFCILLPMYNEEKAAPSYIPKIARFLNSIKSRTAIIAIDDGSIDRTSIVLQKFRQDIPDLIVETHRQNGGYGAANRTGFAAAVREGFDYALVMDADGTQQADYIEQFFEPMKASVDFIKATRYSKSSRIEGVSWRRRIISWAGNKLAQLVLRLPITDYTNGFRAIKTSLLPHLQTKESGFAVLVEEIALAKKLGATFAEVPYMLTARNDEGSKSKFVYSWKVYYSYLKHLFKR